GNRRNEPAPGDCRSFFRQRGTKDDDRMRKRRAQFNRFLKIRDAEYLRIIGQGLRHANHSMPVAVRLDHSKHLGRPNPLSHDLRVVAQRAALDLGPTSVFLFHFDEAAFGIVTCGSRKYIGSSGGKEKPCFGSRASPASRTAEGYWSPARSNCGNDSEQKTG